MAQFLPISKCDERGELFDGLSEPGLVYYILTLGIEKSLRRTGLGTELIRQCIQDASHNPNCGAVSNAHKHIYIIYVYTHPVFDVPLTK